MSKKELIIYKGEKMKKIKHYKTCFENEQELLRAVCDVHMNKREFDLDPMYNKGKFYKDGTITVKYKHDLTPILDGVIQSNAENLDMYKDGSMESIILDPPFMFRKMIKSKSVIANRYTMYESYNELKNSYEGIVKEASRLLSKKGVLVFKCQDFTNSKTTMTHVLVHNIMVENGFYMKDLAILIKKHKITNNNLKQRHLRKTHTYFWVGIKK